MSEEYLFDETSGMSQSEMEIHHFFDRQLSTLFNQKWVIIEQISQWSSTIIGLVQAHSTQQRDLIEQECTKKISRLKAVRDQCLQQIMIYEQEKDITQIHQLLNQCHTLKIKLGVLAQPDRLIPSIQLITDEQEMQESQHEFTEQKAEDEQSQKQPIEFHANDHANNSNEDKSRTSIPIKLPSSIMKSTTDESQSINNHYEPADDMIDHVDLSEKCPICFMIFPHSRSIYQRNLHVNEHYSDD